MGRWGKCCLASACVLLGVGALGGVVTLAGCDVCGVGAACPDNTFGITSVGRCIVLVDSNCRHSIIPYAMTSDCTDGGARQNEAVVFFPDPDGGTLGGTCDVEATLDDGTKVVFSVEFTPHESKCCGVVYDISPPGVFLSSPVEDGGDDAVGDADARDLDATGDADEAGD